MWLNLYLNFLIDDDDWPVTPVTTADYIVEQGVDGIWTYRKWNSGIAECWDTHSWTVTSWGAWGNLYESNNSYVNYPTGLFSSKPIVQIVPNCDNGAVGPAGSDGLHSLKGFSDHVTHVVTTFEGWKPASGQTKRK